MKPRRDILFLAAFILTAAAFFFDLIAFVTPFWVESIPSKHSKFVRIGLWAACFNGYSHPLDMVQKAYYGCWYIYYKEYDKIRLWLNPAWFYACQVLSTVGFIALTIAIIVISCQGCYMLSRNSKKSTLTIILGHFLSGCCLVITLIAIGVQSNDTRWMPWPRYNRLSWSFAFGVFSLAASFAAFICLSLLYVRDPSYMEEPPSNAKYREAMQTQGPYDPRAPHHTFVDDSAV